MGGKETLIYFLFEREAHNDSWTLLQLLEYKTRIWVLRKNNPAISPMTRVPRHASLASTR